MIVDRWYLHHKRFLSLVKWTPIVERDQPVPLNNRWSNLERATKDGVRLVANTQHGEMTKYLWYLCIESQIRL